MSKVPTHEQIEKMLEEDRNGFDERPTMIAVCVVSIVLAYCAVTLRLVARWKARARLEWDDYLITAGLVTTTGFIVASFFMVSYGLGLNVTRVKAMETREPFVKSVISAQVLYSSSVIPIKLSILFLYHRLFPSRVLKKISVVTGLFIIAYATTQALLFILQCLPIASLWDDNIQGKCIDFNAMVTTMGVLNVATDFILVGLPIPYLWNLRLDKSKKIQLVGIFLLGGVVCVFGILRSVFVGTADPTNPSRTYLQGAMWSVLEINVGIVSACLPTLRPLFRARVLSVPTGSSSYAQHSHHDRDHPNIPLNKMRASTRFEDRKSFIKLGDGESTNTTGATSEEPVRPTTRSGSPVGASETRCESRAESRTGRSRTRADRGDANENGGIMVTTEFRVQEV